MSSEQISTSHLRQAIFKPALACLFAGAVLLSPVLVVAQEQAQPPAAKAEADEGFLAAMTRWFDQQATNAKSNFTDVRKKFENFGREAGIAAKTTADGAKDAADAVARIPNARVITGHEKCRMAPNGAPDCVAAANAVCKAKGFESGKSVDMTTAENCPPKVWMSGRKTEGECTTETFVSRVLCQ